MSHEDCARAIIAGDRQAATEAHLRDCAACARLANAMSTIDAELQEPRPSCPLTYSRAVQRARAPLPATATRLARKGRGLVLRPAAGLCAAMAAAALLTATFAASPGPLPEGAVAMTPFTDACDPRSHDGPVLVAAVWTGEERARFVEVLELFERQTGHDAVYAYQTRDVAATIKVRLARGCPPDVALLPQPGLLADLARAGQLAPLEGIAGTEVRENYEPSWRALGSVDTTAGKRTRSRLFGVWFKAADKSTVWYDRARFRSAGVRPPATWSSLLRVAGRLREHGTAPFAVAGADGWTLTDWFENVYLRSAGPELYDALAKHEIPWTHPTVKRALAELAKIFAEPGWLAGGSGGAHATTFEGSVRQVFGRPAAAAMVYEGSFAAGYIAGMGARIGQDAGVFAFPAMPSSDTGSGSVVGGDVAVLLAQQAHKPAARALMRFLATPQAAEPWARAGGFISPNRRLAADAYRDQTMRRLAVGLAGKPVRFDLSDLQPPAFGATAGQGMWKLFRDFLADPTRIDATAERLERAAAESWRCERTLPEC